MREIALKLMAWTKTPLAGPTEQVFMYRTDGTDLLRYAKIFLAKADDYLSLKAIEIGNTPAVVIAQHYGSAAEMRGEAILYPTGEHVYFRLDVGDYPEK
jgi:hypothetical protein